MASVEFLAWCRFDRFSSGTTYVAVELTWEEITRLAAQDKDACSFAECEAVRDIYHKVYEAAVAQITEELREADDMGTAYIGVGQRADDVYPINVDWPTE
jgi:hypothetical protein